MILAIGCPPRLGLKIDLTSGWAAPCPSIPCGQVYEVRWVTGRLLRIATRWVISPTSVTIASRSGLAGN